MKYGYALLFCLLSWGAGPDAALAAQPELQVRFGHYHARFVVDAEGTATETHEWSKTILKDSALDSAKRASASYSTSAQQLDVIAAYNAKADGRRLEVPKDNYQLEVNRGKGGDSPVYSDWSTLTVVFPDVAVGDTVVFSYRVRHREAMFPGQFSSAQLFYKHIAYDDISVVFDYPATMPARHEGRGMSERMVERDGRKIVEWRWANPQPVKSERRDYSVFDAEKEVGYAFSTFADHAAIAAAYGVRALPKARPSERVAALAAGVVSGKNDKREQARALYEWVAGNITYAGNCIGIGAVVPRDLAFVLDNKMGDCKDHATLLQAMLESVGIKSTQALVNAGSSYGLQRIPVAFAVNHVINYLPEFDLFVDSTSDATPFGMLPFSVQGKPVLLVEGHRNGLKTPVTPWSRNRQSIQSTLKVAADGSLSGKVEVVQIGRGAVQSREWARKLGKDAEDDLVKNIFRNQGIIGNGSFSKDDPAALVDNYRYGASFTAEKFVKPQGAGSFYILPPLNLAGNLLQVAQGGVEAEADVDVSCTGMTLLEDYRIELPKTMKILSIPQNLKAANEWASYQASYRRQGNTLVVHRQLEDRTPGNVCPPAMMQAMKKLAEQIVDNVKEQVLYK